MSDQEIRDVHTAALDDRFRAVAAARPGGIAARTADGTEVTYRELDRLADRIARHLGAAVRPGVDCAVVELPRSPLHLAALLAAWRTGLAYVPLRAHEPASRRDRVHDELAGRAVLITGTGAEFRTETIPAGTASPADRLTWSPGVVAYVAFTSGSTGVPKGVALPVSALANRIDWSQRRYPLHDNDIVLQHTAPTFDFAIWEAAAALLHGATLLLTEDEPYTDLEAVLELGRTGRATVAHFVPSVLSLVSAAGLLPGWRELRLLYSGGEPLTGILAARVLAETDAALVNQYGPVETCVDSTHHPVPVDPGPGAVPIGRPIDRTECRIAEVDHAGPGAVGELLIGGAGVALGYLDRAHPANDRFCRLPGSDLRWYRTGDLVGVDATGEYVFRGRIDDQVKVSGLRVELGEIEAVATNFPGVRVAVAVAEQAGDGVVIDLVAEADPGAVRTGELRAWLAAHLAGPAIPRQVQVVAAVPRLSSGKIDRQRVRRAAGKKVSR